MRSDLDYKGSKGKFGAMVAHCSLASLLKSLDMQWFDCDEYGKRLIRIEANVEMDRYEFSGDVIYPVYDWIKGDFAKIVLKVESLEKLLEIQKNAEESGLIVSLIKDNGTTIFSSPTIVGLGIGPDLSDKISAITKDLKLF
jgi:peptidyl-tRNA hydrolase